MQTPARTHVANCTVPDGDWWKSLSAPLVGRLREKMDGLLRNGLLQLYLPSRTSGQDAQPHSTVGRSVSILVFNSRSSFFDLIDFSCLLIFLSLSGCLPLVYTFQLFRISETAVHFLLLILTTPRPLQQLSPP